uniref:Aromatic-L-amino-acid decarboxylase-like n=1 Tax=Populus alba TaxID=43335 RepID=A0A4U5QGR4_POPAL|nr:hypothetical protein D5086_0000090850 [Populus alba]
MGSLSTNTFSPLDPNGFTNDSKMVIDFIADYYKNIEKNPVQSQVKPGYLMTQLPDTAPYCQESLEDVLKDVTESIIPGLTHWQSPNFFAYFQANAKHCRGVKLVGIPSSNFRCLSTSFSSEFSLSPQALEDAIENDIKAGFVPLFLCATVGTTACGAVDPVMDLGKIARKYNLWFHIDAAYAGSACICPEFRHYLDGVELADSLSMNPHKWHGLANLMYHIRSDVNLAKRFESLVAKDSRFEVVVRRRFSLVCFRLKHNDECQGLELNRKLLAAVNESGRAFMTHAVVGGLFIIRCAIGSTLTEERHVDDLWKLIQGKAAGLVKETGAIGE